jgi:FkbM family methyltransferase
MNLAATKEISIFEENRTIAINIYDQPEYISNILQINKEFYEFYVLRYIKKMYPKHNTIVDVGANIGNHAKYFTNFLEHELIYCFEPYVANYNLLKKNIADQKVIAYNCALGAIRGKCKIIEPKENNSGMIKVVDGNDVDIMPLDNFNIENVTLIKIDVEGAEYNVLLGAMRTILKYRPPIFIETNDEKVFELMDLIGYKIGKRFYEGDAVSGDLATIEFIHEANKDAH